MGKKRKSKAGTNTSSTSEDSESQEHKIQKIATDKMDTAIIDRLDQLSTQTSDGFRQIHEDFNTFKLEIKSEIVAIKTVIRDLEKATEYTQQDVEDLKKKNDEQIEEKTILVQRIEELEEQVQSITKELKQERENLINLEQYTRKENLIFNQIPESDDENCKDKIKNILENMGIISNEIKFHAVHRIGKKRQGTFVRPIIARFVSREDRDLVFYKKKEIKRANPNAYITQDYARAIKEERKILIKAMKNGRIQGLTNIKVLDRFLYVGNEKFTSKNLPSYLEDEE